MQIIYNQQQEPQEIFLSLEEWDGLKDSVDANSELYRLMETLQHKAIFKLNPAEFAEYLTPVTQQAVQDALYKG
jgi:hypothetical protein